MAPVILLTGASRGIGHSIATYLLDHSAANLVLVARTSEPLTALQTTSPDRVEIVTGDIALSETAQEAVGAAVGKWGRLDALIVNHGILGNVSAVGEADLEEWRKAFDVNFFSAVELTKLALPHLRKAEPGRIVFVSSGAAAGGMHSWGNYSATKAAMNSFAATVAKEEGDAVITVAVRPGMVDTDMQKEVRADTNIPREHLERFVKAHKEGTLVKPGDAGQVLAKMALEIGQEQSGKYVRLVEKSSSNH